MAFTLQNNNKSYYRQQNIDNLPRAINSANMMNNKNFINYQHINDNDDDDDDMDINCNNYDNDFDFDNDDNDYEDFGDDDENNGETFNNNNNNNKNDDLDLYGILKQTDQLALSISTSSPSQSPSPTASFAQQTINLQTNNSNRLTSFLFSNDLITNTINLNTPNGSVSSASTNSFFLASKAIKQVNKINQDDLDLNKFKENCLLLSKQLDEFLNKYECVSDANGLLTSKRVKLSKALQRKLGNFCHLLQRFDDYYHQKQLEDGDFNSDYEIKLFNYLEDYKRKIIRMLRSLVERVCIDTIVVDTTNLNQNNNNNINKPAAAVVNNQNLVPNTNPTSRLWSEIRARGCQFLGPEMQDDVLRLIMLYLGFVTTTSRKSLVTYVVWKLQAVYDKASRTSVGHVIQLLYRAGCFKVEKRPNESSGMELKREYLNYEQLRKQHDTQIISIALEAGIRMSPEQWSQKLYGDSTHKSKMQSIIDKLQSQQTIKKLIEDFFRKFDKVRDHLQQLNPTPYGSSSIYIENFYNIKNDFDEFANMNELIYENINSAKTASSDTQSNDTNSDNESNSLYNADQLQLQQQQQQYKFILNWKYIFDVMRSGLNILEASIEYNQYTSTILFHQQQQQLQQQQHQQKHPALGQNYQNLKFNDLIKSGNVNLVQRSITKNNINNDTGSVKSMKITPPPSQVLTNLALNGNLNSLPTPITRPMQQQQFQQAYFKPPFNQQQQQQQAKFNPMIKNSLIPENQFNYNNKQFNNTNIKYNQSFKPKDDQFQPFMPKQQHQQQQSYNYQNHLNTLKMPFQPQQNFDQKSNFNTLLMNNYQLNNNNNNNTNVMNNDFLKSYMNPTPNENSWIPTTTSTTTPQPTQYQTYSNHSTQQSNFPSQQNYYTYLFNNQN